MRCLVRACRVGRANTLAEAEQLAAAAAGKKSGRRLTASGEGSESRNATRVSAAAEKNGVSAANNNGYPASNNGWSYSNTGGFYSWVPRPFMNTWVVSRPPAAALAGRPLLRCCAASAAAQAGWCWSCRWGRYQHRRPLPNAQHDVPPPSPPACLARRTTLGSGTCGM